jgi:hypothetical protein
MPDPYAGIQTGIKPLMSLFFVEPCEPAVTNHIGKKDGDKFPFHHPASWKSNPKTDTELRLRARIEGFQLATNYGVSIFHAESATRCMNPNPNTTIQASRVYDTLTIG